MRIFFLVVFPGRLMRSKHGSHCKNNVFICRKLINNPWQVCPETCRTYAKYKARAFVRKKKERGKGLLSSTVAITAIKDSALVVESLKCLRGVSTSSWPLVTRSFINQRETCFKWRRESYGYEKFPPLCRHFRWKQGELQTVDTVPIFLRIIILQWVRRKFDDTKSVWKWYSWYIALKLKA